MDLNKVVIVSADDWEGLYVNGALVLESHKIRITDLSLCVPVGTVTYMYLNEKGIEWIEGIGSFPSPLLSKIPKKYFV
jgi:hypothetical protein